MATLNDRLLTLEQAQRKTRTELVLFYRPEQEGQPIPEQREQIVLAEKQGREVKQIIFRRAEDSIPCFTGLPPREASRRLTACLGECRVSLRDTSR